MKVELKILDDFIRNNIPEYKTKGSAGLDLHACIKEPMILNPGEVFLMSTGLSFYIKNSNYAAMILPRSGIGHKNGIVLGNLVGLIDSDYQGELKVSLWNRSDQPFEINPLDRIAQLIVVPIMQIDLEIVDEFDDTERGEGGFGSTGK